MSRKIYIKYENIVSYCLKILADIIYYAEKQGNQPLLFAWFITDFDFHLPVR